LIYVLTKYEDRKRELYGTISHKTVIFRLAAVRASNLTISDNSVCTLMRPQCVSLLVYIWLIIGHLFRKSN
jgi:hypothetical protein